MEDGSIVPRTAGTLQGEIISPSLASLFLHYASDRAKSIEPQGSRRRGQCRPAGHYLGLVLQPRGPQIRWLKGSSRPPIKREIE
jgi:hypothetical protein